MPPMTTPPPTATRLEINGIVQGVGFRPFVYGLAHEQGVVGWVCNTVDGVVVEAEVVDEEEEDVGWFWHVL